MPIRSLTKRANIGLQPNVPSFEAYSDSLAAQRRAAAASHILTQEEPDVPVLPSQSIPSRVAAWVFGMSDEERIRRFGTADVATCIYTATKKFNDKGAVVTGNKTFRDNPTRYGFEKIPYDSLKNGDLVQFMGRDFLGSVPHHAVLVTEKDSNGNPLFSYSNGNTEPFIIEENGDTTYTMKKNQPLEVFGTWKPEAYRYVGSPEQRAEWLHDYTQQYGNPLDNLSLPQNKQTAEYPDALRVAQPNLKAGGGVIKSSKLWNDLSMKEKSEIMKVAVQNGIYSLSDIKQRYNEFAEGRDTNPAMTGMMKSELATAAQFGNPTARRMTNYDTRSYTWPGEYEYDLGIGEPRRGNVYVGSYGNLVTPQIQDTGNGLTFIDNVWSPENDQRSYMQSLKFNNDADAQYFGDHYKEIAPMMNLYSKGGHKIHIKPENRGKFTRLKERTGHSASWFKAHGTPAQKKMATFALNARHWKHGMGGNLFEIGGPTRPPMPRHPRTREQDPAAWDAYQDWLLQYGHDETRPYREAEQIKYSDEVSERNERAAEELNRNKDFVMSSLSDIANSTPFTGSEVNKAIETQRQEKVDKWHDIRNGMDAAMTAAEMAAAGYGVWRGLTHFNRMLAKRATQSSGQAVSREAMQNLLKWNRRVDAVDKPQVWMNGIGGTADGYQWFNAGNSFDAWENGLETGANAAGVVGGMNWFRDLPIYTRFGNKIDNVLDGLGYGAAAWDVVKNLPPLSSTLEKAREQSIKQKSLGGNLFDGESQSTQQMSQGSWKQRHQAQWYGFLRNKGVSDADAQRLSGFFTAQDGFESAGGTSAAARKKNNYGGMQKGGKNIAYNTVQDYMEDKWKMMNSRFKPALSAKTVDEYATILGNPDTAGKGYLYYVTANAPYNPNSPEWRAAQTRDMHNYINGMRRYAGMKSVNFKDNPVLYAQLPDKLPERPVDNTPLFMPSNPETFFNIQQPAPIIIEEETNPVMDLIYKQQRPSEAELKRAEQQENLRKFNLMMGLLDPQKESSSLFDTIGLLSAISNRKQE